MQARVKWVEQAMFLAESGSGHTVVMDGPEEHGGRNLSARPMEMVLMGLGGCSTFDVINILKNLAKMCAIVKCALMLNEQRLSLKYSLKSPYTLLSAALT